MAEKKIGRVIERRPLSQVLEIFRVIPEEGSAFPAYRAGQYMALSRDNCKLTRKQAGPAGEVTYVYDTDEAGHIRRGAITHSYSIASAPFETEQNGYVEFYIVLELVKTETPGRLSESIFSTDPESDAALHYVNKIVGEFTLERRAAGFENVVLVGTGTGLAPFVSMIKQADFEARQGTPRPHRFTLLHTNRTAAELGYHEELLAIEREQKIDFAYLPTITRPGAADAPDPAVGRGRANNLLRSIFDLPLKEADDLRLAKEGGGDVRRSEEALLRALPPEMPSRHDRRTLRERMTPGATVMMTCGNPTLMADIRHVAGLAGVAFEQEEW
jgi:ferredoxin-NADP reductase